MTPSQAIARSLQRPRLEVIPMKGVEEQLPHLASDAVVTVTVSPTRGPAATVDLVEQVAGLGRSVVPHLSARKFESREHLDRTLDRLQTLAVDDVFIVAGDVPEPEGPYEGAADLLEEMKSLGHRFEDVGITGYPEPHPSISDESLVTAMERKLPYATYIVSQICFDADTIREWVGAVRARGVGLPIHVGIPGVIDKKRLLRISLRVGLGDSLRYLRKQADVATRMATGYRPDSLMDSVEDLLGSPVGIAGWHIYTFNEVERTEEWRQGKLIDRSGSA